MHLSRHILAYNSEIYQYCSIQKATGPPQAEKKKMFFISFQCENHVKIEFSGVWGAAGVQNFRLRREKRKLGIFSSIFSMSPSYIGFLDFFDQIDFVTVIYLQIYDGTTL